MTKILQNNLKCTCFADIVGVSSLGLMCLLLIFNCCHETHKIVKSNKISSRLSISLLSDVVIGNFNQNDTMWKFEKANDWRPRVSQSIIFAISTPASDLQSSWILSIKFTSTGVNHHRNHNVSDYFGAVLCVVEVLI